MKQKAKVAKLITERSLLKEKVKLQAAEEHLQIDHEIAKAKAKAREQELKELEREQKLKLPEVDNETHDSFLALPTTTNGCKHEQPSIPGNSPIHSTSTKTEREETEFSPFN